MHGSASSMHAYHDVSYSSHSNSLSKLGKSESTSPYFLPLPEISPRRIPSARSSPNNVSRTSTGAVVGIAANNEPPRRAMKVPNLNITEPAQSLSISLPQSPGRDDGEAAIGAQSKPKHVSSKESKETKSGTRRRSRGSDYPASLLANLVSYDIDDQDDRQLKTILVELSTTRACQNGRNGSPELMVTTQTESDAESRGFKLVPSLPMTPMAVSKNTITSKPENDAIRIANAEAQRWETLWYRTVGSFLTATENDRGIDEALLETTGFKIGSSNHKNAKVLKSSPPTDVQDVSHEELTAESSRMHELSSRLNALLKEAGIPTTLGEFEGNEAVISLLEPPGSSLANLNDDRFLSYEATSRYPSSSRTPGWNTQYHLVRDILAEVAGTSARGKRTAGAGQTKDFKETKGDSSMAPTPTVCSLSSDQPTLKPGVDKQLASSGRNASTRGQVISSAANSGCVPQDSKSTSKTPASTLHNSSMLSDTMHETMRRYHLPPIHATRKPPKLNAWGNSQSGLQQSSPPRTTHCASLASSAPGMSDHPTLESKPNTTLAESGASMLDSAVVEVDRTTVPYPAPWLDLGIDLGAATLTQVQDHLKVQANLWEQACQNNTQGEHITSKTRHLRTLRSMIELIQIDMSLLRQKIETSGRQLRQLSEERSNAERMRAREETERTAQDDKAKLEELAERERVEVLEQIWRWMKRHRPGQARQFQQGPYRSSIELALKHPLVDEEAESIGITSEAAVTTSASKLSEYVQEKLVHVPISNHEAVPASIPASPMKPPDEQTSPEGRSEDDLDLE